MLRLVVTYYFVPPYTSTYNLSGIQNKELLFVNLYFNTYPLNWVRDSVDAYLFQAKATALASINRLRTVNRRTVDVLASRLYFYYSYCYELTDSLAEIRG